MKKFLAYLWLALAVLAMGALWWTIKFAFVVAE